MGKVSIIVPVYNTEEYIETCVNSLINQTFKNIEIILVNDNSKADCSRLLEKMAKKDNRIKLYHFDKRKGVGAARNFGIRHATGEFIYFLDSDDYLPEQTLQILVENIKDSPLISGRVKKTNFSTGMAIILDGLFKIKTYTDNKFKLIKNTYATNFLIRKDYILEKQLSFSEDVDIYSDLSFIIPALVYTERVPYIEEAVYFKRKRNDPISNPSLIQYDESVKIHDFLYMYNVLKEKYHDDKVNEFLDIHLLNFYRKTIVSYFKNNSNIENCLYDKLVKAFQKINNEILNRYDWILNKEIDALLKGIEQYKKVNKRHHFLRDVRNGLKSKKKFYIFLYKRLFTKLKMDNNLVFFESFLGKSYSDNPKYIYEYMIKNDMKYKYVWSLNEKKDIPGSPIQVKRFSLRYFYYLAKAKYWVSNSRLPKYLNKREGNIYLQTWHGTPLKKLVFDMGDVHSADPNYKKNFYKQSRRWDYLSSPNQYSSEIFRRAFKYKKEMLEYGYPRNDILYQKNNKEDIMELKRKLNLPLDKKIILYAPTWRDDEFIARGKYSFTLQLDLQKVQEQLGDEYIVLLRMHYFISSVLDISDFKGFAYDFSSYNDIAELYLISDILITDYSSVFFDYAHLKRPVLFYTYDLEKYRDHLRGFYIDIEEEVPGPLVKNTDEIIDKIRNIKDVQAEYEQKYNVFYDRFCKWDDGNASQKTVERVFSDE